MEPKFTKGEWYIAGYGGEHDESGASIKCGDDFICHTASVRNGNWGEYYSNAKLITTAPELVDVLLKLTNCIVGADSLGCTIIRVPIELSRQIGAVIEKATTPTTK